MKKILALLLSICMLLPLIACGTKTPSTDKPNDESQTGDIKNAKLYPLNTKESLYSTNSDIPAIIFSTTGAENGLSGTIYSFSGKMIGKHPKFGSSYFVVETKYGEVLMMNVYNDLKDSMPVDKESYATPEIGEEARFTCIYDGFSGTAEMPCFTYGNDSLLLSTYTDSNETEETEETTTTIQTPESKPIVYEGSGDKVITNINLDSGRYKVRVIYTGNSVFSVFGYDDDDDMVLMESSYGACDKEDLLRQAKFPLLLEITADGSWKIEFEKID